MTMKTKLNKITDGLQYQIILEHLTTIITYVELKIRKAIINLRFLMTM